MCQESSAMIINLTHYGHLAGISEQKTFKEYTVIHRKMLCAGMRILAIQCESLENPHEFSMIGNILID